MGRDVSVRRKFYVVHSPTARTWWVVDRDTRERYGPMNQDEARGFAIARNEEIVPLPFDSVALDERVPM